MTTLYVSRDQTQSRYRDLKSTRASVWARFRLQDGEIVRVPVTSVALNDQGEKAYFVINEEIGQEEDVSVFRNFLGLVNGPRSVKWE